MNGKRGCVVTGSLLGLLLMATSVWGALGDPLWETHFSFLPDYDHIIVTGRAASNNTFIITGYAGNLIPGSTSTAEHAIAFIKAFDAATGNIKWEKTLSLGANYNNFNHLIVSGNVVMVRALSYSYTINPYPDPPTFALWKLWIQAFQVDTGILLWEAPTDFETSPQQDPVGPLNLVALNNRVFTTVAKIPAGQGDYSTCYVRAYLINSITPPIQLLLEQ